MPPTPRKRPRSLEAHDLCVRARVLTEESPQAAREAHLPAQARAIELDPGYSEAHGLLAYNRWSAPEPIWGSRKNPNRSAGGGACPNGPSRSTRTTPAAALLARDSARASAAGEPSRMPSSLRRWSRTRTMPTPGQSAVGHVGPERARKSRRGSRQIRKAFRLNPYPAVWSYGDHLGQAQYTAPRDYKSAIRTLRREETYRTNSRRFLAGRPSAAGAPGRERAGGNVPGDPSPFHDQPLDQFNSRCATGPHMNTLWTDSAKPVFRNETPALIRNRPRGHRAFWHA